MEQQAPRPLADLSDFTELADELTQIGARYGDGIREQVMWTLYRSALSEPNLTPDAALFGVLKNQAAKAEFQRRYGDEIGEMAA